MIYLGLNKLQKPPLIDDYCSRNAITKVVILGPDKFRFNHNLDNAEDIDWPEIIMYRTFYRLLQEIDYNTLIVVNECLRTQNRHDLTYNCIRQFLNQTEHQLIFQWLPIIDDKQDFMVLFDFDTRSRWKREKFDIDLIEEVRIQCVRNRLLFNEVSVETDEKLRAGYQREKQKLADNIGIKDPHTIPRNLYLMSGKARMQAIEPFKFYIGRNNRFKIPGMQTYKEPDYPNAPYTVFELPHNFIDFADFSALSQQTTFDVLLSDLKVDQWYKQRYNEWTERINETYANIS